MRIACIYPRFVLDQVAGKQDLLLLNPGDRVTAGVARTGMPDLDLNAAEVHGQLARQFASDGISAPDDQGRPGQARH